MPIDPWLPIGFQLPGGARTRAPVAEGADFQIYEIADTERALVARSPIARRWAALGLPADALAPFSFGLEQLVCLLSGANRQLAIVDGLLPRCAPALAMAFAEALRETRRREPTASLHDAIFVERYSRLLPIWSASTPVPDDEVLGSWLSGGVRVSALSLQRLAPLVRHSSEEELELVIEASGVRAPSPSASAARESVAAPLPKSAPSQPKANGRFCLPGREQLERFFNEHVIDIVQHGDRYRSLGIEFPSAIALHGPPGSGKTFAVERLVEYLGWPSYSIDSSSIGSPYMHETGRKIARLFEEAVRSAPSVVVIDEMEAFLVDRQSAGFALHRLEEVAEFLRRIPEATKANVLVIGMTNRIELIDPAILRRGRFDHVIEVGMPTELEVSALLAKLLANVSHADDLGLEALAKALTGRALSDVAFVVREGARLAARAGRTVVDAGNLRAALDSLPPRSPTEGASRSIGFR